MFDNRIFNSGCNLTLRRKAIPLFTPISVGPSIDDNLSAPIDQDGSLVWRHMRVSDMPVGTTFRIFSSWIKLSEAEIARVGSFHQPECVPIGLYEVQADPVKEIGDTLECLADEEWTRHGYNRMQRLSLEDQVGKTGVCDGIYRGKNSNKINGVVHDVAALNLRWVWPLRSLKIVKKGIK